MNTINPVRDASDKTPLRPLTSGIMLLTAALFRLIPPGIKPPNVAPVGALALFGGARLPLWQAFGMQLMVMFISDILLWQLFSWTPFNLYVYASFAIYVLMGRLLRNTESPTRIAAVSMLASVQFFLITNFGFWYSQLSTPQQFYAPTLAGLLSCYAAGLLFFAFTLAGDLGFSAVLFGLHAYANATVKARAKATAEAEVISV
jgi:Family of unknown function (DUF6580)